MYKTDLKIIYIIKYKENVQNTQPKFPVTIRAVHKTCTTKPFAFQQYRFTAETILQELMNRYKKSIPSVIRFSSLCISKVRESTDDIRAEMALSKSS